MCSSDLLGTLATRVGPLMASMDRFDMEVVGRGGHGAYPHKTSDPVTASAAVIGALQTVVSRRVDPVDPAVVSVCTLEAPGAFNVIPERVKLSGTCRSLSPRVHAQLPKLVREIASGAARALGCRLQMKYSRGTPVLMNASGGVDRMRRLWADQSRVRRGPAGSRKCCIEMPPTMGGEDFAFYLKKVKGAFSFLGAAPAASPAPAHNPRFDVDERVLAMGVALHVALALEE